MHRIKNNGRRVAAFLGNHGDIIARTPGLQLLPCRGPEGIACGKQHGVAGCLDVMRQLAQRSASAAREIKSLIAESGERVRVGTELVAQAGTSVNNIVDQVRSLSQLIESISRASLEQSGSVSDISQSISSIDNMTQRNAALVEESAAAADSLRQQAVQLEEVVRVFKIA